MGSLTIRRAGPESFDPAFQLLQRFFVEEGFTTPADQIQSNLRAFLADARYAAFLAFDDQAAVGVITVSTATSIELGRMAEIDDLYVEPSARGRGLARRLIEAARAWLQAQGGVYVQVTVTPEGEAAHGLIRFYTQLGFRPTGRSLLAQDL